MRIDVRALILVTLLCPALAAAQTPTTTTASADRPAAQAAPAAKPADVAPPWKLSGYLFGDYYYFASNHDPKIGGQHGFWFRRGYFTYDHTLAAGFSTRFRLEVNSDGDFTNAKLTPFVKDAYLRWARGSQALLFGMSGTPTFEFIESVWGYRSVEKTPLDLQRWSPSRDFGIAAQGTLDKAKAVNYHVMFGNGSDTGSEVNKNKAVRAALSYRAKSGFMAEGYVDWDDQPSGADRSTMQAFVGYRKPAGRVGVQYAQQKRRNATTPTRTLDLLSVFAVAKVNEKNFVLARVDRMFNPNPDGAKIAYLPFDAQSKSVFAVVGWHHQARANVHFIPNVEFVTYSGSRSLDTDIVPRMTFYFTW